MNNDNNTENVEEESVSLFDMYGVDQTIRHKEPTIKPVIEEEEENEEVTEEVKEEDNSNEETPEEENNHEEENNSEEESDNDKQEETSDEVNNDEQEEKVEEEEKDINSLKDIDNKDKEETSNNSNSEDEELVRTFVGNAYDKFLNGKFNVGAFFLGSSYFFYRKMTLYGIIYTAINLIAPNIIKLVVWIAAGFLTNKIYLDFAKGQVEMIKENLNDKTEAYVNDILKDQGGTSVAYAIGMTVVVGIVSGLITFMLSLVANA